MERLIESNQFQAGIYERSNEFSNHPQVNSDEYVTELKRASKEQRKRGRQCLWKICNWKVDLTQKKSD